jgi:hypothetical protein
MIQKRSLDHKNEIKSVPLSEALKKKSEFTKEELESFVLRDLSYCSYIQVGDTFFQPDKFGDTQELMDLLWLDHSLNSNMVHHFGHDNKGQFKNKQPNRWMIESQDCHSLKSLKPRILLTKMGKDKLEKMAKTVHERQKNSKEQNDSNEKWDEKWIGNIIENWTALDPLQHAPPHYPPHNPRAEPSRIVAHKHQISYYHESSQTLPTRVPYRYIESSMRTYI